MKAITEFLKLDPVFITSIITSVIGLCGALGIKELLAKMYDRWCSKADQKDSDHQQLQKLSEHIDKILAKLDVMEKNDRKYLDNDMLLLEHDILFLQRKAILYGKVSTTCYPRYVKLLKRYRELNEDSNYPLEEEIEVNHKRLEKMLQDGDVVQDFWDFYK